MSLMYKHIHIYIYIYTYRERKEERETFQICINIRICRDGIPKYRVAGLSHFVPFVRCSAWYRNPIW